jgi:hypothetical protein
MMAGTTAPDAPMKTGITDWLRKSTEPRHIYELLGRPILDTDRDALLQTLRDANRELLDYQSHPDPAMARRAMLLIGELGRARAILEDPARLQAHDQAVVDLLRQQYIDANGPNAISEWNQLRSWLMFQYRMIAPQAERVARLIRNESVSSASGSRPRVFAEPLPLDPDGGSANDLVLELDDAEPRDVAPVQPSSPSRRPVSPPVSTAARQPAMPLFVLLGALAALLVSGGVLAYVLINQEPRVVEAEPPIENPPPAAPAPAVAGPGTIAVQAPPPAPASNPVGPIAPTTPENPWRNSVANPGASPSLAPDPMLVPRPEPKEPEPAPAGNGLSNRAAASASGLVGLPFATFPPPSKHPWVGVENGKLPTRVEDVEVRLVSAELGSVLYTNEEGTISKSPRSLLVRVEVLYTGEDQDRVLLPWLKWPSDRRTEYNHCWLRTADGTNVVRPKWYTLRTRIADVPTDNLPLRPGKPVKTLLIFEDPPEGTELILTLHAIRSAKFSIATSDDPRREYEAGTFEVPIRRQDLKK